MLILVLCGLQVSVCLEGEDARVLQELQSAAGPPSPCPSPAKDQSQGQSQSQSLGSPLALLHSCLLLCLDIR